MPYVWLTNARQITLRRACESIAPKIGCPILVTAVIGIGGCERQLSAYYGYMFDVSTAAIAVVALGTSNVCIECESLHPSSMGGLLRPALVFTQPK